MQSESTHKYWNPIPRTMDTASCTVFDNFAGVRGFFQSSNSSGSRIDVELLEPWLKSK
jgi:hypothetical protein